MLSVPVAIPGQIAASAVPTTLRRQLELAALIVACAILTGVFVHTVLLRILARLRHKNIQEHPLLRVVVTRGRKPALWIVVMTMVALALPFLDVPAASEYYLHKTVGIGWFLALGWLMIAGIYTFEDVVMLRVEDSADDNVKARRVRTQLMLMRRLAIMLALVIDAGLILSLFQDSPVWHYGAGLLASAGLASLVLATAAKSTASNLLAGMQIALTEPIRLGDVVIVEGEWGRIEEINTTFVVVAIWDYRRLVVPLTYFIDKPFQNWTREKAELMGTAFLYVDYSVPVAALREEFTRVLEESPLWDRNIVSLQVTNLSERTMELRCLMSARNSGEQFDLRCLVREKMVDFIQREYPDAFPRTRFAAVGAGATVASREALTASAASRQAEDAFPLALK